jgi:2-oxoacid:acceptor oxidoreductase delta subunit (pyruvate/2-ketoisovalerate family)
MKKSVPEKPPMAAATAPTTANKTGSWRFERPVFEERLAPCSEACPLGEHIPAIMALHREGSFEEAYQKISLENPFPGICGQICFHPCERVCNRGRFDEPVSIRDLERFVSLEAKDKNLSGYLVKEKAESRLAVVGSGAAGLSCAYFLALLGHDVTLLEKESRIGMLEEAVPGSGLAPNEVQWEVNRVLGLLSSLRLDASEKELALEELARNYQAVYLSPGDGIEPRKKGSSPVIQAAGVWVLDEGGSSPLDTDSESKTKALSRSMVRQFGAGKRAALLLDMSLRGTPETTQSLAVGRLGSLSFETYCFMPQGKNIRPLEGNVRFEDLNTAVFRKAPRIKPSPAERRFSPRDAISSAKRCFHCGICTFCYQCYDYCPDVAIRMDRGKRHREIDYDHCKGCGICAEECPRGAIGWAKEK